MTGALYHRCLVVGKRGVEPNPTNIRVFNNTIYSGSKGDFIAVDIDPGVTNISVLNNLGSAPSASKPSLISGMTTTQSSNLLKNSPSALFGNTNPSAPASFGLTSGSPARDVGTAVPVFSDFFGTPRPLGSAIDVGAAEGF